VIKKSIFCVFEGIDGSGKTTLIQETQKKLLKSGITQSDLLVLREPTSGETGLKIRECLSHETPPSREEWIRLFIEDRKYNVKNNIFPALEKNQIILQDRYFYSTAAYQGDLEISPSPEEVLEMNLSCGFPLPDILFFLDISPEESLERVERYRQSKENFETLSQQKKFYENFLIILPENCIFLDAARDTEELAVAAAEIILEFSGTSVKQQ